MAWSFDFIATGIYSILIGHCTAQRTEEILNGKLHFLCSADGFRHSMRVDFELGLFFKIKIL